MLESTVSANTGNRAASPLRIGSLELPSRVLLAPMAGITDRPFRRLCRDFGAGLAFSEMLSANPELRHTRTSAERLDHRGEPRPFAVQIAGADPAAMADFARYAVDQGADLIDINLGCPAKTVCRQAAGSALLRDEPLVARILTQVVRAVRVPVSVKTRTGWSPQERNLARIARIAEDSGILMLSVHGRTRKCDFRGQAEHSSLAGLREHTSMVLVANGDIDTPESAHAVLEQTGADAVMIGRAALGNPWIFDRIRRFLTSGERVEPPGLDQIRDVLLSHLEALHAFYGMGRGPRVARKHIVWYCQNLPRFAEVRKALLTATSAAGQRHLLQSYLTNLVTGEIDA
ncbi:putative tRNA-dihydrouridine synthase [Thiorhodovibrio winogradskyi]|uniref:tRNA-dihydrouridine synthase n=1 Tax=Thiorhodovibrio winogradskyi TaxID=77007 RepID=A0ABZ0S6P8_9GAMM|nr:tRNA dihydrouridine synthase DusB [Thiorhodovibrio winogradskyi]